MAFTALLRGAFTSLRRASLRSSLATLGIIIGVAAVIAIISVGNGARSDVKRVLATVQSNRLEVFGEKSEGWRPGYRWGYPMGDGVLVEDYLAVREQISGIAAATIIAIAPVEGSGGITNVTGVDTQSLRIYGRTVVAGTPFGDTDIKTAASVCIITEYLARTLFPDHDSIGRSVRLGGVIFTVIGVLANDATTTAAGENDTGVIMPYTSLIQRVNKYPKLGIVIRARDPKDLGRLQADLGDLLERRRGTRIAKFTMTDVSEIVRQQNRATRTLTLLLGSIAGISLIVGGIGIMNVMFVSVAERTREIGVRLALGTRPRDVMLLFALEAIALSLCGGFIGILVGGATAYAIAWMSGWPTLISPSSILLAFLCSAACGVFFGYYPAQRAAALDPVHALRAE